MTQTKFVRPGDGRVVYREDGARVIPDEGESVPLTTYYLRRLSDGDLVSAPRARPKRAPKSAEPKGEK